MVSGVIRLVADEWVNMERQQMPTGGWVEDTVSCSIDGAVTHIDRTVMLPGVLDRIDMTIGFAEEAPHGTP